MIDTSESRARQLRDEPQSGRYLAIDSAVVDPEELLAVCPDGFIIANTQKLKTTFEQMWEAGL